MLDLLITGLLLGWGAAIPIGAINLEIIRRNLRIGTGAGFSFGLGACCADITYLVLLSLGVLHILNYPSVLKLTGILGSLLLAWFGYKSLQMKTVSIGEQVPSNIPSQSYLRHMLEGYLLTLINPYTILFWSSISVTIAVITNARHHAVVYAGIGVLVGTMSWVCALNLFLHLTRHRLPKQIIQKMNVAGGLILLGFAVLGCWRALS